MFRHARGPTKGETSPFGRDTTDILWREGIAVATWEMQDGAFVQSHSFGVVSNGWQITGTGEFDLV